MNAENNANRILVQNAQARQDRNPDHHIAPGPTSVANLPAIRDDARHLMSAEAADQNHTARHHRRRNATTQQSKLSVKSAWQQCSQTHQSLKATAGRVLQILRHETQSSVRKTTASVPTRPTSSVEFEEKPKVLMLEEGCKAGAEVVARISGSYFLLKG